MGLDASHALGHQRQDRPGAFRTCWKRSSNTFLRRRVVAADQLQALIFDSWFDSYRGVVVLARVIQGVLSKGQRIRLMSNGRTFDVETLGILTPKPVEVDQLSAGEVGFMIANIKNVADTKIGDTITDDHHPAIEALPGFEELKPMVFAGLYTVDHTSTRFCAKPWKKYDSTIRPSSSSRRVRWPGLRFSLRVSRALDMEIIEERLEREYEPRPDHDRARRALQNYADRRHCRRGRQSFALADPREIAKIEEPGNSGDHPYQRRVRRRNPAAGGRQRGKQKGFEYLTDTGHAELRIAA